MKIPKYIDEALKKRTKAANVFNHYDGVVSDWIEKSGLADDIDPSDYHGGVESIVNPEESEIAIREAAVKKERVK